MHAFHSKTCGRAACAQGTGAEVMTTNHCRQRDDDDYNDDARTTSTTATTAATPRRLCWEPLIGSS